MRTRAAILRDSPGKFEVVDVELDDPRRGEIRVKLAAAGLCHSDDHLQTGDSPPEHAPIVAGHLCNLGAFTWRGSRYDDPDGFRGTVDGQPCGPLDKIITFD
jgi:S-(hydroxymethyl)glutathione dehydrogenase/alcohol dehydrogenase